MYFLCWYTIHVDVMHSSYFGAKIQIILQNQKSPQPVQPPKHLMGIVTNISKYHTHFNFDPEIETS